VTLLGELAGSLAHELNQPLTAILSNVQAAQLLLRQDAADPGELQEILREIEGESLLGIVEDYLCISGRKRKQTSLVSRRARILTGLHRLLFYSVRRTPTVCTT
jgi:signal transduction histidine kinase